MTMCVPLCSFPDVSSQWKHAAGEEEGRRQGVVVMMDSNYIQEEYPACYAMR